MKMNSVFWPRDFMPGDVECFFSNEVIVGGLCADKVWDKLSRPHLWPTYYKNISNIYFFDNNGHDFGKGDRFRLETFGLKIDVLCKELISPSMGNPGRLGFQGSSGEDGNNNKLEVYLAWLVEDLEGGRVRILIQETQRGKAAAIMYAENPNMIINEHQNWLNSLVLASF